METQLLLITKFCEISVVNTIAEHPNSKNWIKGVYNKRKKDFLKKMSTEYEARGLSSVCVENEQVGALHTENNRERSMNESL